MKEQNKRPDKLPTCELGGAAARGASSVREQGPLQPDGTCPGSFSSSRPWHLCAREWPPFWQGSWHCWPATHGVGDFQLGLTVRIVLKHVSSSQDLPSQMALLHWLSCARDWTLVSWRPALIGQWLSFSEGVAWERSMMPRTDTLLRGLHMVEQA